MSAVCNMLPIAGLLADLEKGICGSDVHCESFCVFWTHRPEITGAEAHPVYNTGKMGLVTCSSPMCLGHESSGIVVQLGQNVAASAATADKRAADLAKLTGDREKAQNVVGNAALHVGDRVTLEPGTTCRMCTDCRMGRYQVSLCYTGPTKGG